MRTHDFTPLFDHYPEVIAQMPPTFTSHKFILRLAREHQREYIEALYAYRNTPRDGRHTPFMIVHGRLARQLQMCSNLVAQIPGMVPSHDVFGESNNCAQWRKV